MKVDLSCPLEVRGYELTADGAGRMHARIRLYNLSKRRVCTFEAVARWENSKTGASAAVPFTADQLRAHGRGYFALSLATELVRSADNLELNFTKVGFDDGEREWRAGGGMIVEISETEPLSGPEQNALFAAAGEDAIRFPQESEHTWACVCGRVNPKGATRCVRCRREREEVFSTLTRAAVLRSGARAELSLDLDDLPLDERRAMRRREAELHKRFVKKRTALIRRTIAAVIAVLVLAAFSCFARGDASADAPAPSGMIQMNP